MTEADRRLVLACLLQALRPGRVMGQRLQRDKCVMGRVMRQALQAAHRVNEAEVHVLLDLMGWIPEGRQARRLPTWRACEMGVCSRHAR